MSLRLFGKITGTIDYRDRPTFYSGIFTMSKSLGALCGVVLINSVLSSATSNNNVLNSTIAVQGTLSGVGVPHTCA